jgi:hypothetical protein
MFHKKIRLSPILMKIKDNLKRFKKKEEILKESLKKNQEKLEIIPQKLLFNSFYINEKKEILKKYTHIQINMYKYIFSLFTLGIVTLYYIKI